MSLRAPAAIAALLAATACAAGPAASAGFAPIADHDGRATLPGFGISFTHEPTWRAYPAGDVLATIDQVVGYVSTEKLHQPCTRSFRADGSVASEGCGPAVDHITGARGMYATWVALTMPGRHLDDVSGSRVQLAGRDARWSESGADENCSRLGGTATVVATVQMNRVETLDDMLQLRACLMDASDSAAVRRMVDSLQSDPRA
ncbi:MAG: hypothetical protein JWM93_1369 [Frankiales bacterium]|nr:hypothetical protein [Frankiales bacterium]